MTIGSSFNRRFSDDHTPRAVERVFHGDRWETRAMTGMGGVDRSAGPRWRWDVALSFAGAQREYVERVAGALQALGLRCFYDADEQIELWGKYLAEELPVIYGELAAAVVVFVSSEYAARDWTRLERRAALNRAVRERREYVLPAVSMTRRCQVCWPTWSRSTCAAGPRSSSPK